MQNKPKYFVIDVDGTFTTGETIISNNGSEFSTSKIFDKDGWAGVLEVCEKIQVICIGDGTTIDEKMFKLYFTNGMPTYLWGTNKNVTTKWAVDYIGKQAFIRNLGVENVIYLSASWFDKQLLKDCYMGIVPGGLRVELMRSADVVLQTKPGHGCVLDACISVKSHLDYVPLK